jgi:hypothetical protein
MQNRHVRIAALHRRFVKVQISETHCLPHVTFSFNPRVSS